MERIQKLKQRIQFLEEKFDYVDNFLNSWVPEVNKKLGIGQEPRQKPRQKTDTCTEDENPYDGRLNRELLLYQIKHKIEDPHPKRNTGFQTRKIF